MGLFEDENQSLTDQYFPLTDDLEGKINYLDSQTLWSNERPIVREATDKIYRGRKISERSRLAQEIDKLYRKYKLLNG